jgi:hypothetical protein
VGGPLSEAEFDQLSDFLAGIKNPDALTLECLDGFVAEDGYGTRAPLTAMLAKTSR